MTDRDKRKPLEFPVPLRFSEALRAELADAVIGFESLNFHNLDIRAFTANTPDPDIDSQLIQYTKFIFLFVECATHPSSRIGKKYLSPYRAAVSIKIDYSARLAQTIILLDDRIFGHIIGKKAATFNNLIRLSEPIKAGWPYIGELRIHPYDTRYSIYERYSLL